jgi:hypothetical protein
MGREYCNLGDIYGDPDSCYSPVLSMQHDNAKFHLDILSPHSTLQHTKPGSPSMPAPMLILRLVSLRLAVANLHDFYMKQIPRVNRADGVVVHEVYRE